MSAVSSSFAAASEVASMDAAKSEMFTESTAACLDQDIQGECAVAEGSEQQDSGVACATTTGGCDELGSDLVPLSAEETAEREAWGFDDVQPCLGIARDSAVLGRKGVQVGFMIAEHSTKFGFGIAKGIVGGIAAGSDGLRVPVFGRVMRGVGGIIRGAELITECSQAVAKGITLKSIDVAVFGLDAAGAEKYALAKKTLGEAEFGACVAIGRAGAKFVENVLDLDQKIDSRLVLGLALCATTPRAQPAGGSPEYVDISLLARWAWLAMLTYPPRQGCGGVFKVNAPRHEFLAAAAAERGCAVLLDRATDPPAELYVPAHAVLVDDSAKVIVVSVRGTTSLRDVLCDLVCEPIPLASGELLVGSVDATHVHEGMWRAAQRLLEDLDDVVATALEERPGYQLVITGHSLGAGVACLLALAWRPKYGSMVTCVAFASPPTLDAHAARAAAAEGVTSFVLGDDIIPRLSVSATVRLTAEALQLADNELSQDIAPLACALSNKDSQDTLPAQEATQEHFAPTMSASADAQNAPPALRPAGCLIHLGNAAASGWARVAEQEDFADIVVSSSMLSSHLLSAYLRALGEI